MRHPDHQMNYLVWTFRAYLREKRHFNRDVPKSVLTVLIYDAYHKAAAIEKDGRARWGGFDNAIEYAADNLIAAFEGQVDVDPRIKGIMVLNHLLDPFEAAESREVPIPVTPATPR
jgi:hypothetical protein